MTTQSHPTSQPTPDQIRAAEEAEARMAKLLALGDVTQANAATGIYGDSGTGKSSLCATAIEYCWNRYHKISRYVCVDPGGFGNKILRLIRLGICQAYNPSNHIEPFETMEDLSHGYWPETIIDPFTGYAAPDVRLVPPQTKRYSVYCQQGHLLRSYPTKAGLNGFSLQCPTCKGAPVTAQTWGRVEETIVRAPMIKHVGLYLYDSGTAMEDWAMDEMGNKAAANDPNLKDGNSLSNTGARILSGKYAFGGNTQQHYGFAQNRIRTWIKNTRLIPGIVVPPIWTFLEQRATDDNKNVAIYGPKIAGNAKTTDVPAWLGNCLHVTKEANTKGQLKHRMYLVNHTDPGGNIPHLAKTRAEPGTLPTMLEDQEGEPDFTRFSMHYFFDQLEEALNKGSRQDAEQFADAPLFVPLADTEEEQVVSVRGLGGSEITSGGTAGRQTPQAPAVARPAVAAAPAVAKPATAPAAPPAAAPVVKPATSAAAPPKPAAAPIPTQVRVVGAPVPSTAAPAAATPPQASAPAAPTTTIPPGPTAPAPPAAPPRPAAVRAAAPPPPGMRRPG